MRVVSSLGIQWSSVLIGMVLASGFSSSASSHSQTKTLTDPTAVVRMESASGPVSPHSPVKTTTIPRRTTSTTVPVTTTTVASTDPNESGPLEVTDGQLTLGGHPYRDVGVDAYELGTDWGVNWGCGSMLSDTQLNGFFAGLPVHSLVRIWAFQGMIGTNSTTKQLDWGPLDRVFTAAAARSDLLIVSLGNQDGVCDDGHWKDLSWYEGGYRQAHDDYGYGLASIPYWNYVQDVVAHFAGSPAIGMWEPINEPEASNCDNGFTSGNCYGNDTCSDETAAAQALRGFFDTVGAEIHALDPAHLVEAGFLGSGQCGTQGTDYEYVGASPGLDVLSYHDYYPAGDAVGGDQWNGIAVRTEQAAALHKPVIAGEVGIGAGTGSSCPSPSQRASDYQQRFQAQSALGTEAFLLWDWVPTPVTTCDFNFSSNDPAWGILGSP